MIYESVVKLCNENGITVAKLERELKLSNETIRRWKKSAPSITNAQKVAEYFHVTLDSLVKTQEQDDE